jgi:L-ribulose-5-phosphate 3-epimerase
VQRRAFLKSAVGAAVIPASQYGVGHGIPSVFAALAGTPPDAAKPMALGLMIQPASGAEAAIARVKELGIPTCFLSLDGYIGKFNASLASEFRGLLDKYGVTATSAEVVGPGRLVWDFLDGPSTIGLVPPATRAARIDALKQTSDFAKLLGVGRVQTHCGFLPENPRDPLYGEAVEAIRAVADHCAGNGQDFLMETGQETPTTLKRAIEDVNRPNLGVGLDTANLILYGKANPVDAVDMIGPHVKSVHAKDGKWPTDPMKLGEEVLIGTGSVDFLKVFTKLREVGYKGAITIEREISGPQQIEDVKKEKMYLEDIITKVQNRV